MCQSLSANQERKVSETDFLPVRSLEKERRTDVLNNENTMEEMLKRQGWTERHSGASRKAN